MKVAFDLVKKTATAKFDESIDVAVNLGIDSVRKSARRRKYERMASSDGSEIDTRSDPHADAVARQHAATLIEEEKVAVTDLQPPRGAPAAPTTMTASN